MDGQTKANTTVNVCFRELNRVAWKEKRRMGNLLFGAKRARKRSKAIDASNLKAFKASCQGVKVLVLGTTNTGKSTILKQLRILYGEPYSGLELGRFRRLVHSNTLAFVAQLYDLSINEGSGILSQADADAVYCLSPSAEIEDKERELIKRLWADPGFQQAYLDRAKAQIPETAEYFITKVDELSCETYLPTVEHILRLRVPTRKLTEYNYTIDGTNFTFYDASSQENNRKKWLHLFKSCQVVIFVVSLADYDVPSSENPKKNKLDYSLDLLAQVAEETEILQSLLFVILNKQDVLRTKINTIDPSKVHDPSGGKPWKDYKGGLRSHKNAEAYFLKRAQRACTKKGNRKISTFVCCGTDSKTIDGIFCSMESEIINKHTSSMFSSKIFSSMSETVSKTDTDAKSRWKRGGLGAALKAAKQNHLEAE
jgi:hypothetical protein